MDSRTLAFADEIRRLTGGRGVDVVLNSLAGEFVGGEPGVLAAAGASSRSASGDLGARPRGRGAARRRVHRRRLGRDAPRRARRSSAACSEESWRSSSQGALAPLPRRRVRGRRGAARLPLHGAGASHRKDRGLGRARGRRPPTRDPARGDLPDHGRLALGWVCSRREWLVERGARHLALVGRQRPLGRRRRAVLTRDGSGGRRASDRSWPTWPTPTDGARCSRSGRSLPPLRGVIHSAGVLDDGVLPQHDWARFRRVLAPKVDGGMDPAPGHPRATRSTSSCSSPRSRRSWARPARRNHAAANAFLDALAHHRRRLRPARGEHRLGRVAGRGRRGRPQTGERRPQQGIGGIPPREGLAVLGRLLGPQRRRRSACAHRLAALPRPLSRRPPPPSCPTRRSRRAAAPPGRPRPRRRRACADVASSASAGPAASSAAADPRPRGAR